LKKSYGSYLPPAILRREKQGFSIPIKTWLNTEWNGLMHDVLNRQDVSQSGVFNWDAVSQFMREHETGRANHSHILWALIVFHLWKRKFLKPAARTEHFQTVSEGSLV
jgi:asparagine synthase (glutamine-hydrolysing)